MDYGDGIKPPDGFTGLWQCYWPNGRIKVRFEYSDGKRHGRQECWWDNGKLCQEGMCENDECVGVWRSYLRDGRFFKEEEFYRPKSFDVRWYEGDRLIRVQRFRDWIEI